MTTPRLLSERYELGDTLGYGGMSEVHKGRDVRLSRDVAVKVLRADLARDPTFQMRFRREAQNAAALNHPAIVAVYDTGETESEFGPLPYIVMEFVDGQTLREIVKSSGPLSHQRVIEVMADVCAALDFSHRHGIIHRDVKPANVMITKSGAVKVMDFGIARALADSQNMTQTAAVIGTAQYLSPEQARGEAVDARSDVYAAGCVLFELLTGEPPFSGDSPVAVAYQHVREEVRHPSEVNPDVPHELDAIVLKAMSKNPANRYQSSAEMRQDLVRVLRGQRPLATPVMTEEERTALLHGHAGANAATSRLNSPTGATRHAAPPAWANEENAGRSTGKMIGIGVGALAMLAIIIFVATRIFGGTVTEQTVQVPNITGQSQIDAMKAVTTAGLRPSIKPQASGSVQVGSAIGTDPPANSEVAKNSQVFVLISNGAQPIPDVSNKSPADAAAALQAAGYTANPAAKSQPTTDASKLNKVLNQDPKPNAPAKPGTQVTLWLGTQGVAVPSLRGQDVATASATLEKLGLHLVPQTVAGPANLLGKVVSTTPAAGSVVAPNGSVNGGISDGSQTVMPNLIGKTQREAEQALSSSGIDAQPNFHGDSDDDSQTVIQQSIKPGAAVGPNTTSFDVYLGNSGSSSSNNSNGDNGDNGNGDSDNGRSNNGHSHRNNNGNDNGGSSSTPNEGGTLPGGF